jgi:hypothetical protein
MFGPGGGGRDGKRPLERCNFRMEGNIKMVLKDIRYESLYCMLPLSQQWTVENTAVNPRVPQMVCNFLRKYEGVSISFRTGCLERELQMVQLCTTGCSYIAILWVCLVSVAAITLYVASQQVFIIVVYFVIDSVRKLLDTLVSDCQFLERNTLRRCYIRVHHHHHHHHHFKLLVSLDCSKMHTKL